MIWRIVRIKDIRSQRILLDLHDSSDHTAARLAQWDKRRPAEREAVGSNPGRTNTQGLKITEEKVLPL